MACPNLPEAPIFRPTAQQFQNFAEYVKSIEPEFRHAGICKVIPPVEWIARAAGYEDLEMTIPHPIEQVVTGKGGFYEVLHVERKPVDLAFFRSFQETQIKREPHETLQQLERKFWKNITFQPPLYGSDIEGSLFDKGVPWNLSELDSMLRYIGVDLPGINTPYLYFGLWRTMFGWHKEDVDLFSINYLHFGEPKGWYCVPTDFSVKLEALSRLEYPDAFRDCDQFLRHKTTIISPLKLQQNNVPVYKAIQEAGQFVITSAGAYHSGFNYGFNCAEAVNFALECWSELGRKAKSCKCRKDSVKIDVDHLVRRYYDIKAGRLTFDSIHGAMTPKIRIKRLRVQDAASNQIQVVYKVVTNKKPRRKRQPVPKATDPLLSGQYVISMDDWVQCDTCNKWRKQDPNSMLGGEDVFVCSMHGITCDTAEEPNESTVHPNLLKSLQQQPLQTPKPVKPKRPRKQSIAKPRIVSPPSENAIQAIPNSQPIRSVPESELNRPVSYLSLVNGSFDISRINPWIPMSGRSFHSYSMEPTRSALMNQVNSNSVQDTFQSPFAASAFGFLSMASFQNNFQHNVPSVPMYHAPIPPSSSALPNPLNSFESSVPGLKWRF
eukprot:GILK01008041.1.p1 GENE.GILK01008041.1~~GILK01008041.1.p1  ORF type:complete len:606 (+),score=92.82 GILK01008041.1:98-1915(+)